MKKRIVMMAVIFLIMTFLCGCGCGNKQDVNNTVSINSDTVVDIK